MTTPTVREIVKAWLKKNGYDGLANCRECCGCSISDLLPCESCDDGECQAAYLSTLNPSKTNSNAEYTHCDDGDYDEWFTIDKPADKDRGGRDLA